MKTVSSVHVNRHEILIALSFNFLSYIIPYSIFLEIWNSISTETLSAQTYSKILKTYTGNTSLPGKAARLFVTLTYVTNYHSNGVSNVSHLPTVNQRIERRIYKY